MHSTSSSNSPRKRKMGAAIALALGVSMFGVGTLSVPAPAHAQWVVTDPMHTVQTIIAEAMRAADAAADYAQQYQQLQTQLQQYQNMVQQAQSLPDSVWANVTGDLQRLAQLQSQSRSISHTMGNIDQRFRSSFGGYDSYLQQMGQGNFNPTAKYRQWADEGFDNARFAIRAAGMQSSMFESEDQVMQRLVQQSQSATGRMQAIQVGNQIAAQQVQQMQKLRELMATQITMQANALALATDEQAQNAAAYQQFNNSQINGTGGKGYTAGSDRGSN